jgi:hypothetical protein
MWDRERYKRNRNDKLEYHKARNSTPEVKAARKRYRDANKDRDSKLRKEKYAVNLVAERVRSREKYLRHKEQRLAYGAKWREKNRERHRKLCREWIKDNPARALAAVNARRARKEMAMPSWVDTNAIRKFYVEAKSMQASDGIARHVDHIIPLKHPLVCGLHVPANLRIITAIENMKKGARLCLF